MIDDPEYDAIEYRIYEDRSFLPKKNYMVRILGRGNYNEVASTNNLLGILLTIRKLRKIYLDELDS